MFDEIKKNFGFGCMRLPMKGEGVDLEETKKMVDYFIDHNFNYFDTAHGYISGKSELALKECLTKRYPRDKYLLTDKLTDNYFKKEEDIIPFFKSQLEACGVSYFDFYLMHAQNAKNYEKYKRCNAYKVAFDLKEQGYIKHVGISFHDKADVLERILTENPEIEIVQIQFNYLDYLDPAIESKKCYEVCVKHNKQVIVMEPVKGGSLVNLPKEAQEVFDKINTKKLSNASYAIRFAASHDNIRMVLSGMSNLEQMIDNLSYMENFEKINDVELEAINKVCKIYKAQNLIPCTACRYCVDGCPKKILIPDLFACLNAKKQFNDWNSDFYYSLHTENNGKASDCIKCGKCEQICPQNLPIRELLVKVSEQFDK